MSVARSKSGNKEHQVKSVSIQSWRIKTGPNEEQFCVYFVAVELASGLKWEIEKRYKQFRGLRRDIQRVLPTLADLEFPSKHILFWNLHESTLQYRADVLTRYMSAIVASDPELQELTNFLQVVNNVSLLVRRRPSSKTHPRSSSISEDRPPTINDFKLLRIIGQGSFGKVFLVKPEKDTGSAEAYAMKVLNKEDVVRRHQVEHTKTEREIMAKASHPFIVSLRFAFQTEDKLYMITEYCPGGELYFHLKKMKTFSVNMMQFYCAQIAMALEYLHRKNIIYRDLKPENVLLDRDGNCKLTDFGLSKIVVPVGDTKAEDGSFRSSRTDHPYTFCGTPEYLSPEMLVHRQRGTGYGFEIDWWGLGIVSFELIVGWVPFFDRDFGRMCEKIMTRPVRFPSKYNVPKEAQDFVKGLLQRNPQRRLCCGFHRAGELKNNPFFADMNWDYLERGLVAPPFLPKVSSRVASDAQNFENLSTFQRIAQQKGEKSISTQTKEAATGEKCDKNSVPLSSSASNTGGGGMMASSVSSPTSPLALDTAHTLRVPQEGAERKSNGSFSSQTVASIGEDGVAHSTTIGKHGTSTGTGADAGTGGEGTGRDSETETLSGFLSRVDLFADFDYIAVLENFDTGVDEAIDEGDESEGK